MLHVLQKICFGNYILSVALLSWLTAQVCKTLINYALSGQFDAERLWGDVYKRQKQAPVETRLEPEVKGVAVLCEGGDDILVIKRITDLVATVLDIPTNRICVAKMI